MMDALDDRIVALLRANGRRSNRDIGRELGVAEGTVRKRIRRLIESGVMQIAAVANPYRIGYSKDVLIAIHADLHRLSDVAARLAELPEVRYVMVTTGAYDLIAAALFRSDDELFEFLVRKLAAIDGIRKAETAHSLEVVKRRYDWVPPSTSPDPSHDELARGALL
ncbi:MAG: Lrp/AsnC family transcriptional regulator [Chloroflexi bacterium]|nr:Lrp/AsnC family transcriptional regulator [Chloroflexota bacterium]